MSRKKDITIINFSLPTNSGDPKNKIITVVSAGSFFYRFKSIEFDSKRSIIKSISMNI